MEIEKDNSKYIFIILILCILVLGLGGYIIYEKATNNNGKQVRNSSTKVIENTNENENSTVQNTDENENSTVRNTDENENIENLEENSFLDFDFEEMKKTIKQAINGGDVTPFVRKCIDKFTTENGPDADYENIDVANNTIDIVINKLKTAKSIDKEITFSWFGCPPKAIDYYVSVNSKDLANVYGQQVFYLSYANSSDTLLIGYDKKGYAFHFNNSEEINNFIESLLKN